jgi:hypothetical protein
MITTPRILAVIEERCVRVGNGLRDDGLNEGEMADLETSLLLLSGALGRFLDESVRLYAGSQAGLNARAAHNDLQQRLHLVNRYRADLSDAERRRFLREAQESALEAIRALRQMPSADSPLVLVDALSA